MRFLDTFLEVYPDACVIQTHRDPAAVFSSYVSLISGFRALVEDPIDRSEIARRQLELWVRTGPSVPSRSVRNTIRPNSTTCTSRISCRTPSRLSRKTSRTHFGLSLSNAQGEQALNATGRQNNPQHKHGKHVYSRASEDVGLSSDEIREPLLPLHEPLWPPAPKSDDP